MKNSVTESIITKKVEESKIINYQYTLNNLKKKILKNKVLIIAIIMMICGLSALIINLRWILGFEFSHKLSDIDKDNIKSGMCIRDNLKYTYGNVATEISTKTSDIYIVDIGPNNDNYILIRKYQSSFYGDTTEIDGLQRIRSREYKNVDEKNGIKIYGIVKHSRLLKSSTGLNAKDVGNALGISQNETKQKLVSEYEIELVSPEEFCKGIIRGICLIVSAAAIILFVLWKDKKSIKDDELVDSETYFLMNEEDRVKCDNGLFKMESLRNNTICSIMIENESIQYEIEDSNVIQKIKDIIDTVSYLENAQLDSGKSIYLLKIMFEDCSFMLIDLKEDSIISYLNEYGIMDEDKHDDLIKIIKKEISNNEEKL